VGLENCAKGSNDGLSPSHEERSRPGRQRSKKRKEVRDLAAIAEGRSVEAWTWRRHLKKRLLLYGKPRQGSSWPEYRDLLRIREKMKRCTRTEPQEKGAGKRLKPWAISKLLKRRARGLAALGGGREDGGRDVQFSLKGTRLAALIRKGGVLATR